MDEICAEREKTCGGGKLMQAAPLMALNAGSSSGEVEVVREAAVSRAWKQ